MKFIKKLFSNTKTANQEERYLSQATSLEDLERRQRNIMRNQAPWQRQYAAELTRYKNNFGA